MNASRVTSWKQTAGLVARLALSAVFLLAAAPKIAHPHAFAESIYRYHLLGHDWINLLAVYLPWLELTCAFGLLIPRLRRGALLLVLLMLVMFTGAIAINVYRGVNIDCGCFSVSHDGARIGWLNLARNAGFIALTILGWRWSGRPDDRIPLASPSA